jgi:23S rRNA pseudouridine955/2504/2580 synthase
MKQLQRGSANPAALPKNESTASVAMVVIDELAEGQRVDNFLLKHLKGVPKSHIYRILRSGEVRVNSGRVGAEYRLTLGDKVRIPPVRTSATKTKPARLAAGPRLAERTLYEDDALLIIDKPAGLAVHGGSGVSLGAIEQLRLESPGARFLELVHRLDRDTSGVLLLAKKRGALVALHAAMRDGAMEKRYLTLAAGSWKNRRQTVRLALTKYLTSEGERRVSVDREGQVAHTDFTLVENLGGFSLLDAHLRTGRTHQIRVHLAHLGFPIVGDDKYGDFALNKTLAKQGMKRMFLHAHQLGFVHPLTGRQMIITAPLPVELEKFIAKLRDQASFEKTEHVASRNTARNNIK